VLASTSRTAVLGLLRSRGEPLGVVEIAEHVGLHQNTVRSHLDLLVEAGYAIRRSEAPSGPGRPRVVYQATEAPDGERDYRLLAEVLAQHIVATSQRSGQAPISQDAAIGAVVRMLGDAGFAPEVSADGTSINLHRCPFRELAVISPDVVCGAHLGIIQGALEELGGTVSATRLLPFVTPGLCVTTLFRP
jgi:predicted ArsR family transcriptional regulator